MRRRLRLLTETIEVTAGFGPLVGDLFSPETSR
jgi:hypothetical protein